MTATYATQKKCEQCDLEIPDEFQNLLCMDCYAKAEVESQTTQAEARAQQQAEILKNPASPQHPDNLQGFVPVQGIQDPTYKTNPEANDKNQILANLGQFVYTHRDASNPRGPKKGVLLYYPQRNMYTFVRNYVRNRSLDHPQSPKNGGKHIWKLKVVDVGCGSGVGANIVSQEADFVWGIDKNEWSIEFAKEAFTREKNSIYYTPQLTFDVFDIMQDTRETMKFDVVVAIEVIEHVEDAEGFVRNIIGKFTKRDKKGDAHIPYEATEFFISTPNRNSPKIRKDKPENPYHVREWTSQEFHAMLSAFFEEVELMNIKGETIGIDAPDDVVFARCRYPKI